MIVPTTTKNVFFIVLFKSYFSGECGIIYIVILTKKILHQNQSRERSFHFDTIQICNLVAKEETTVLIFIHQLKWKKLPINGAFQLLFPIKKDIFL